QILGEDARPPKSRQSLVNRFPLANRGRLMLETARTGRFVGSLQGCSSAGRVPVSKTGCRRFEPCRPCQSIQLSSLIYPASNPAIQPSIRKKTEIPMRQWIYAATASLALLGAASQANALPVDRFAPTAIPSDLEQTQFI